MFGRKRRDKRKKGRLRDSLDCGCDLAEGCSDCNPLLLTVLLTSFAGYFSTPRVSEGRVGTRALLRLIRSYQRNVSARRPAVCNLEPTCSRYGYAVIRDRGLRGVLEVRRRTKQCAQAGRHAAGSRCGRATPPGRPSAASPCSTSTAKGSTTW